MLSNNIRVISLVCLGLLLTGAAIASYKPTDLGSLGGPEAWALGVNARGAVVGCSIDKSGNRRAFLWTEEQGMIDIGTLGGPNAAALAINDSGEIVGYSETTDGAKHAFLRTADGNMVDLGVLEGDLTSEAAAVEDLVVGHSSAVSGPVHAFSWNIDSGISELQPLVSGADARALDVNSVGVAVGTATDAAGNARAVIWTSEEKPVDLGTLGGPTGQACSVNTVGVAVGEASDEAGTGKPFWWSPDGGMRKLAVPKGFESGRANSINKGNSVAGAVIGKSQRAVVWELGQDLTRPERRAAILPLLRGATESEASAISDNGLVAGWVRGPDGKRHAVLWKPVDDRGRVISIALVAGAFAPANRRTREDFDDLWTRVSVKSFSRVKQTSPHFTFEFGSYRFSGSTTASLIPISAGIEKGFEAGPIAQSYFVVRGGPYFGKLENSTTGAKDRNVGINLNAAYGVIFAQSFYVEFRYDYFSKLAGVDFSGASLSAGVRLFDIRL